MKRVFLPVFLAALWSAPVFSQDLAEYDLKGPVRSLTEKSFRAEQNGKSFKPTERGWLNDLGSDHVVRFDEKGRYSYTALLADDGTEHTEETYEYSGDRLVGRHSAENEAEYKYDDAGLLTEVRWHSLGTITIYVNAGGKPAEIWSLSAEGDTIAHELLEYDANGHLTKQYAVPLLEDEFSPFETTFVYDAEGRIIREARLTEYGHWVKETTYEKGRKAIETISYYSGGMLTDTDEAVFDRKGLVTEERSYDMTDPLSVNQLELVQTRRFAYAFDKKGNWTRKTITVIAPDGSETYYVVEREITYFR